VGGLVKLTLAGPPVRMSSLVAACQADAGRAAGSYVVPGVGGLAKLTLAGPRF